MISADKIPIIYQDDLFVVCNKPSNLPVHKNSYMPKDALYLTKLVGQQTNKSVYNVHRLDSKTSGLIMLAFSPEVAQILTKQFEKKEVKKTYYAVVKGNPGKTGTFDKPVLIKKKGKRKNAVTHFMTIQTISTNISYKDFKDIDLSLVEIQTETGRWHQIRQHFAMHRFDIIGDTHHGDWTLNKIITEKTGIKRLFLHAGKLNFNHPETHEKLSFEAPAPEEFSNILTNLSLK